MPMGDCLSKKRLFRLPFGLPALAASAAILPTPSMAQAAADEPQPPAFAVPFAELPTVRLNAAGEVDPTATEEEVRTGARALMEEHGLVRNFEYLYWIPAWPESELDEQTGAFSGGGLDGMGEQRALMIAGKCLFGGFNNDRGDRPALIWRIADDPVASPPTLVGEIPQPPGVDGAPQGVQDDTIILADFYTKADGTDAILLVRAVSTPEGGIWSYEIDPADCSVVAESEGFRFSTGDVRSVHEAGLWVDPDNPMRHLIVTAAWTSQGLPDATFEGEVSPDLRVLAVTDESTGELLPSPLTLAHFTLEEVGGPLRDEEANEGGIFLREGRYPDWTAVVDQRGEPVESPTTQSNAAHQAQFGPEGDRIYVAQGTAGLFVLNSEAIADNTDADLAARNAGCNWEPTNVWVDEVVGSELDMAKVAETVNDCLHLVLVDEPGVQQVIEDGDAEAYRALVEATRFDPFPSNLNSTGAHSANIVPGRYSLDRGSEGRPAYAVMTTERPACPGSFMWLLSLEVEAFPYPVSAFGLPSNELRNCIDNNPVTEPDGVTPREDLALMNHNPTVFENLIFVTWYANGLRAIDISNPFNMREVGHVVTVPAGVARSFPVVQDGLVYWSDNRTGTHVARYIGPRADELPMDGRVYMGSSPHPTR